MSNERLTVVHHTDRFHLVISSDQIIRHQGTVRWSEASGGLSAKSVWKHISATHPLLQKSYQHTAWVSTTTLAYMLSSTKLIDIDRLVSIESSIPTESGQSLRIDRIGTRLRDVAYTYPSWYDHLDTETYHHSHITACLTRYLDMYIDGNDKILLHRHGAQMETIYILRDKTWHRSNHVLSDAEAVYFLHRDIQDTLYAGKGTQLYLAGEWSDQAIDDVRSSLGGRSPILATVQSPDYHYQQALIQCA